MSSFVWGSPEHDLELAKSLNVLAKDAYIKRLTAELEKAKKESYDYKMELDTWRNQANYWKDKASGDEIERLKANLKSATAKIDDLVSAQRREDGRDNELRVALNQAKQENKHLKRLMNDRGQYNSGEIESFDEKTPESLAELVEFEIGSGAKTSFAAACLVLMHRMYKDVVRKHAIYAERNAKLVKAVKAAADVAITN